MTRLKDRIHEKILPEQAAYQRGRSTTEHVFAIKTASERTISAKNETLHLILLDMSKAFDSIDRKKLLQDLKEIIDNDELHIMQKMLNVNIAVRCGKETSDFFATDTGAPQGDCSSATEFILYLAETLKLFFDNKYITNDHDFITTPKTNSPKHLLEHDYYTKTQKKHFNLLCKYADDVTKASSDYEEIQRIKENLPSVLKERNLILNETKTEQYTISTSDHGWKKCKLLGSYLDTEIDIKNRKILLYNAANQLTDIFKNNRLPISTKQKTFNAYLSTIFLYNSEIWTLTEGQKESIDAFHRRMLRTFVLNIRYPTTVTNEEVYTKTKQTPWSQTIKIRRIRWLGHLFRMNQNTPASKSLNYALEEFKEKEVDPD